MKKIVIGICGLGQGHTIRQKVFIDHYINKNYKIVLLVSGNSKDFYTKYYPNIKSFEVKIPFIACNSDGINFEETILRNKNIDFFTNNMNVFRKIIEYFEQPPDLVISDYDPISAQFSYIFNVPLITMEQQSKFLGFKTEDIGKFSQEEEAFRLRYFFPKADLRISSSFFKLNSNKKFDYNVILTNPILDNDVIQIKDISYQKKVLVYLSPFDTNHKYIELLNNIFKKFDEYEFHIFCKNKNSVNFRYGKVNVLEYNRKHFLRILKECCFVISNSGHQLISESVYLSKPIFLVPLNTYEQNYNTFIVEKYKLGKRIDNIDFSELINELKNYNSYVDHINVYKLNNNYMQSVNDVFKLIESYYSV